MSNALGKSLTASVRELINTVRALYRLAPAAVAIGNVVGWGFILVALSSGVLMIGCISVLMLAIALMVFARTRNFGEASLALLAGLLAAVAVEWTHPKFVLFTAAVLTFFLLAMLIASVRLAARVEELYLSASLTLSPDNHGDTERELKRSVDAANLKMLSPEVRAEATQFLAFRRFPLELIAPTLQSIERLTVTAGVDWKQAALFVADLYTSISTTTVSYRVAEIMDAAFRSVRNSPVPPVEYFAAFAASRRLLLSREVPPAIFFTKLEEALGAGASVTDVVQMIKDSL
jgi:hypothetical protein